MITEANDVGGLGTDKSFLTFTRAFTPKPSTLDLRGKADLHRNNQRSFTIIEPLTDLAKKENRDRCKDRTKGANWTYPITGTIGLDEVVRTYIKLEMLTELRDVAEGAHTVGKFPGSAHVVFSDELTFTTHFSAGASTTLVLDAVVGRLSVTNASLGVNASRRDQHSLIVALTREKEDVAEKVKAGAKKKDNAKESAKEERKRLIKDVRDPRSQARLYQMNEQAEDSLVIELHQRRNRKDGDNEAARALGQRLLDVLKLP